ncbi:MAG: hypothetical protein B7Z12_19050, partial [Caulobacter vibrioides]
MHIEYSDEQIMLRDSADRYLRDNYGFMVGLIFSGSAFVLIYAYSVRFLAVSFNTVESSPAGERPADQPG